jgi:hypothetical protein
LIHQAVVRKGIVIVVVVVAAAAAPANARVAWLLHDQIWLDEKWKMCLGHSGEVQEHKTYK